MKHCICFYLDILILLVCVRVRSICTHALSIRKITHVRNQASNIAEADKVANCLFASKDHVRSVTKRLCVIFMACSCPKFVLGR